MCVTTVDGIPVIRDGTSRLRWAHEQEGAPPPVHAGQWQVGDLWPDEETRQWLRRRVDRGEPAVVLLDADPPRVELPVEHVPRVPRGVLAEHDPATATVTVRAAGPDAAEAVTAMVGILAKATPVGG